MVRGLIGLAAALWSGQAAAQTTDFGIRVVGGSADSAPIRSEARPSLHRASWNSSFSLAAAASLASRFGRVTSTHRSPEHNRRVGGARNSWHLAGRAIDIARAPGVSHAEIAAAFRAAGYHLIESLDEGDHTHLAFGFGLAPRTFTPTLREPQTAPTTFAFRVVSR